MKKTLLSFLFFLSLLIHLNAQKIGYELGIKAGADYSINTISNLKKNMPFNAHGGAFLNLTFPILGLQIEGLFGTKNVVTDSLVSSIYNNARLNYINIPVLLEYTTLLGFLTVQMGPQFGILLDKSPKVANNTKDLYNSYDLSLIAGIKGNIPAINLHVFARYIFGIKYVNTALNSSSDQIQFGLEYGLFSKKIGGL